MMQPWLSAFAATGLISIVPNLILFFLPIDVIKKGKGGLNVGSAMLTFAAGGMMGDVFIHSVPHLFLDHDDHGHDHGHAHDHVHVLEHEHRHEDEHGREHGHDRMMIVGLLILLGYVIFYVAERLVSLRIKGGHHHSYGKNGDDSTDAEESQASGTRGKRPARSQSRKRGIDSQSKQLSNGNGGFSLTAMQKMTPSGWLNLVADSMHNFTDGVAIGSAFSGGGGLALVKVISVLFHEVPHEIGDFTILVHAGLGKWEAIQAQFVTAIAAFVGTAIGFMFSNLNKTTQTVLLATTSGGFLYISTGIIGALASNPAGTRLSASYSQIALEVVCFAIGVGIMVLVAFLEEGDHAH